MQTVGAPSSPSMHSGHFRVQFGVTDAKQFKIGSSCQEACSICGDAGSFVISKIWFYQTS